MQTDILASQVRTTTGQMTAQNAGALGRVRVKAIYIIPAAGAGSVVLRDGGSGGAVKTTINTLASSTSPTYLILPGQGLLFNSDVHATVTDVTSVTVFYG
jgi:hypothetical protein